MAKKDKKSLLPDRKNAPKRTGKGMKPLDALKDFDTPTRKEPEASGKDKAAGEQQELLEVRQGAKPAVVDDRFEVSYRKPIFSLAPKSGDKLLAMQMSVFLTDEHKKKGLLPSIVRSGWDFISKPRRKSVTLVDVPGQTVTLFMASDSKDEDHLLHLPVSKIINATLAVITKKGEGDTQKAIRFLFRVQVPFSREIAKFAESNYGNTFWMTMKTTEEKLFDEEDE